MTITRNDEHTAYAPSDDHNTEFFGENEHNVWFRTVHYVSCIGACKNKLNIVTKEGSGEIKLAGSSSPYTGGETSGFKVGSDLTLADGSSVGGPHPLILNGHTVKVNGSFYQGGDVLIDVDDSEMILTGDYVQKSGILIVGSGMIKATRSCSREMATMSSGSGAVPG